MSAAETIWRALMQDERDQAISAMASALARPDIAGWAVPLIAQAARVRESTLQRTETTRRAYFIRQAIPRLASGALAHLALIAIYEGRGDLLSAVYEALGLPHDGREIDEGAEEITLDPGVAAGAVKSLGGSCDGRELWFCLAFLSAYFGSHPWFHERWNPAFSAAMDSLLHGIESPATGEDATPLADREPKESAPEEDLEAPSFSTLDRLLIGEVIQSLNRIDGSLDLEALDDLVQEVCELNSSRHRSWFHRGFVDALFERSLEKRSSGENRDRRAWYLVGSFFGSLRRDRDSDVVALIGDLGKADKRALRNADSLAGAMLAEYLIPALLEDQKTDAALRWIGYHGARVAPMIIATVMSWSSEALLERRDPQAVGRIVKATLDALHQSPMLRELPDRILSRLRRRLAIALRIQNRMEEAGALVRELLAEERDPDERSLLLDQQVLISLGVRSLETLGVPEQPGARKSLVETIEEHRRELREATESEPPSTVALLALAIPAIVDSEAPDIDRAEAASRLRVVSTRISESHAEVWERSGLRDRVRFYLALLDLRSLEISSASVASGILRSLLEEGVSMPSDLTLEAVNLSVLSDAPQATEIASFAIDCLRHEALEDLNLAELSRQSGAFRNSLKKILDRASDELRSDEKWNGWSQLLRGSLSAQQRDLDTAREALDSLELLATESGHEEEFLRLLEDPKASDPAWSELDRQQARFRILQRLGRVAGARECLAGIIHSEISSGRVFVAREMADVLQDLDADASMLGAITARLPAEETASATDEIERAAKARLSIYFIGGNETQAAYTPRLREHFSCDFPNCLIEFDNPGWGAN